MSDTLRDQLLGLGFKPAPAAPRPEKRDARPDRRDGRKPGGAPRADAAPRGGKDRPRPPKPGAPRDRRSREEIDLAKAYAIRAQKEKDERIAAEAARQEEARQRREARARLGEFLKDKTLNEKDADIARHFPYGGKIKRVYVTADQLRALNAGELGVVQLDGRYALVTLATLDEAERIFPQAVALRVDPNAAPGDDPYSDPRYQVPDDLVW
ncbi:DUF2058 domain-containing protein [Lysobacter xanthus]